MREWLQPYVTSYGRCHYGGDIFGSTHHARVSRFVLVMDPSVEAGARAGEVLEYVRFRTKLPTCSRETYARATRIVTDSMNKPMSDAKENSEACMRRSMVETPFTFARVRWFKYKGRVKASLRDPRSLGVATDIFQQLVDGVWYTAADPREVGMDLVPVQRIARKFVQSTYTWRNLRTLRIQTEDLFQACPIRRSFTTSNVI